MNRSDTEQLRPIYIRFFGIDGVIELAFLAFLFHTCASLVSFFPGQVYYLTCR